MYPGVHAKYRAKQRINYFIFRGAVSRKRKVTDVDPRVKCWLKVVPWPWLSFFFSFSFSSSGGWGKIKLKLTTHLSSPLRKIRSNNTKMEMGRLGIEVGCFAEPPQDMGG